MRFAQALLTPVLAVALLGGCTGAGEAGGTDLSSGRSPDGSTSGPSGSGPSGSADRTVAPKPKAPKPPHPVSLEALMAQKYDGGGLRLVRERVSTDAYTQHEVTDRSGDLTISGVLNVPNGRGPFPALVLAHGYIDPAVYVTGQGLVREQDHLARQGYVTLHVDYRNHAGSDDDPSADLRLRLGYTEDVINAVLALRRGPRFVDDDRIGLLGRSMGGGVVYNVLVVRPGLVDAAVAFAPVSSDTVDALRQAGKDVQLRVYEGEEHAFVPQWPLSMERTTAFFDRHLRG